MRATIASDQALAEIRKIERGLQGMSQRGVGSVKAMNTEFGKLGQTVRTLGNEVGQTVSMLGRLGGVVGVGLSISALGRTLADTAKRITELRYASRELGMSERDIRAWEVAAQKAGISAESMRSGMEGFKKVTDGLKYNIGGARDELYAMGAGPIVQRMQAATTQAQKLKIAFNFKDQLQKSDPSGFSARHFFDQIQLGADKARLSYEEYTAALAKTKPITEEEQAAAKKYADALVDLGTAWDNLTRKVGVKLFPWLADELNNFIRDTEMILRNLRAIGGVVTTPPAAGATDPSKGYGTGGFGMRPVPRLRERLGPGGTFQPTSFGGGGDLSDGSRMVKDGVFAALVEFSSYVQTGGGAGGGGIMNASFGGSGGAAAGGGFKSGGGYSVLGSGGGGPAGSSTGGGAPAGTSVGTGAGTQAAPPGAAGQYRPEYKLGDADLSDDVVNTIAGEARGSQQSTDAVINNMMNRIGTKAYGPSGNLRQVARAPGQYVGYQRASPERAAMIRERIKAIASGKVPDETGGSNEFRTTGYGGPWSRRVGAGGKSIGGNTFAYNPASGTGTYAPYGNADAPNGQIKGASVGEGGKATGDRVMSGRNLAGTDPRITEIMTKAAEGLPPGYKIQPTSGRRTSGQGQHTHGAAQDWQIIDPSGKAIRNRGDDVTGLYTKLAQNAYGYQEKHHPDLTGKFHWGGQFGTSSRNPNEPDLMHFGFGGRRGRISKYSREAIGAAYPPTPNIDNAIAPPPATGNVKVDIVSNGTAAKASASADGLFNKSEIRNYKQMQPTEVPANLSPTDL
ncbi:MAG: hypothetical protein C0480_01140 [Bradyrhizobium sp.]|nr:hypothetical protein [Bradyrhizobium sp.]